MSLLKSLYSADLDSRGCRTGSTLSVEVRDIRYKTAACQILIRLSTYPIRSKAFALASFVRIRSCSRSPLANPTTSPLHVIQDSMTSEAIVIPEEDVRRGGAVSIFPTVIHKNYASVNQGAVDLTAEYNAEMNMDMSTHTIARIPGIGPTHVTALCIPHCLDDRLEIMTRFTELTFLNDGMHTLNPSNGLLVLISRLLRRRRA